MTSEVTQPNAGLVAGWADGEVGWGGPMNINLKLLDAILQLGVISNTVLEPPATPANGDRYLIPATGATGDWASHANQIAAYYDSAWVYFTPKVGWTLRVAGGDRLDFDGTAWVPAGSIQEAPDDGVLYARKNKAWSAIGSGGGLPEAPEDGKYYARKDGAWVEIADLADAPQDGKVYGRKNGAWIEVTGGGSSSFAGLTDVNASKVAAGNIVGYDGPSAKYTPKRISIADIIETLYGLVDPTRAALDSVISNGGHTVQMGQTNLNNATACTPPLMSGKLYWEVKIESAGASTAYQNSVGVGEWVNNQTIPGTDTYGMSWGAGGQGYFNGTYWWTLPTWAAGDVLCFAYDAVNRYLWVRKNGDAWSGALTTSDPVAGTGGLGPLDARGTKIPIIGANSAGGGLTVTVNFGDSAFAQTPPTGFTAPTYVAAADRYSLADIILTMLSDKQGLFWDATQNKFVNGYIATRKSSGATVVTLDPNNTSQYLTLSADKLTVTQSAGITQASTFSTTSHTTGKYYVEWDIPSDSAAYTYLTFLGFAATATPSTSNAIYDSTNKGIGFGSQAWWGNNGTTSGTGGMNYAPGDTVMLAVDCDAGKAWIGVNGTWGIGNPGLGTGGMVMNGWVAGTPLWAGATIGNNIGQKAKFRTGQSGMKYAIPSGFSPWTTADFSAGKNAVGLADVSISNLQDGDMLAYDKATDTFKNKQPVTPMADAPSDGNKYTRKNGAWASLLNRSVPYGAHKYWRISCTAAVGSGAGMRMAEMRFFDANGTPISTSGGTAFGSTESTGFPPANAFDGNTTTWYRSNGAPTTGSGAIVLGMQFPAAQTVAKLQFVITDNLNGGPATFDVQYSDDGSTYTTAWSVAGAGPYTDQVPVDFVSPHLTISSDDALRYLSDVQFGSLLDGQAVVWSAALGKFTNGAAAGGGTVSSNYNAPFKGALARLNANKSISAWPYIASWDNASYDSDGFWSSGTPTRLTIPAGKGIKKIRLTGVIGISYSAALNSAFSLLLMKNGATSGYVVGQYKTESTSAFSASIINFSSPVITVADGDYFEVRINAATSPGSPALDNTTVLSSFGIEVVELATATNPPFDVPMYFPGVPAANQRLARIKFARSVTIAASSGASHQADADAAATGAVTITLKVNGSSVGTVTFAAGTSVGVVNITNAINCNIGDVLTADMQGTADATLGNISITLQGTRN